MARLIEDAREQIRAQEKRLTPHTACTHSGLREAASFPHEPADSRRFPLSLPGLWVTAIGAADWHPEAFRRALQPGGAHTQRGGAVLLLENRQDVSRFGERRFRVGFSGRMYRECRICAAQRSHCPRATKEWLRSCDTGGAKLLRALHLHSGLADQARALARSNIDVFLSQDFDALITNAAGCGSTLKEYDHLLHSDLTYRDRARRFKEKMKDVTEFLADIELNSAMGPVDAIATYQDSCHLAHGQKIRVAPRKLLKAVPGLRFREMPMADLCCGSAGIYNVVQSEMANQILQRKMEFVATTKASLIVTANPGCMLQLSAGARLYGTGQRVAHVVEVLDDAYKAYDAGLLARAAKSSRFVRGSILRSRVRQCDAIEPKPRLPACKKTQVSAMVCSARASAPDYFETRGDDRSRRALEDRPSRKSPVSERG